LNQQVEAGKTLLVDGPASIRLSTGKAEALGFSVTTSVRIVVREGKRLPFYVIETSNFDISLGKNVGTEEIVGNTVPQSWIVAVETIKVFKKKPMVTMIVGKSDSGKTSFCTYLTNILVNAKQKTVILDGDIGQSDIGPPCTIAYAIITENLTALYESKLENAYFVGVTSPSLSMDRTIRAINAMKEETMGVAVNFLVVNTDGWVEGEEAVKYKVQLAGILKPDMIVCIQQKSELDPLLAALKKRKIIKINSSIAVKQRSTETRRALRERSYAKHLKDGNLKIFPLNQLTVEDVSLPIRTEEKQGSLLGFYDARNKFLGLGVLRDINLTRKTIKVLTSVVKKPSRVIFGKVRLDENLKETGFFGEKNDSIVN
jgi:polynucleotide 5'-hydroxyl-kinase GRC3/NOL9